MSDVQASIRINASVTGAEAIEGLSRKMSAVERAQMEAANAGRGLLQSLRDQLAQASMTSSEYLRYQAALTGVSSEAAPLIAELAALKKAQDDAAKAARNAAREEREQAAALATTKAAQDRFLTGLQDQLAMHGKTTAEMLEYKAAQLGISSQAAPLIAQLRKQEEAMHAGGVSAKQHAAALQMVPAQMTDIATSIAGGMPLYLVAIQQGGQLRDMFGGFGPMFRALASFITPVTVGFTALAAVVGSVAYAFVKGRDESAQFAQMMRVTGGAAGYTEGQYNKLAQTISDTSRATIGDIREMLSGLMATGQYGPQAVEQIGKAMARVQSMTGQSADDVVKDFASMSAGVAKWAEQHNKQYNFLSVAQYKYIADLEKQGKGEEAAAEAARLLDAALAEREKDLGTLESAWLSLQKAASSAWKAMLDIGRKETPNAQLEKLKAQIADNQQFIAKGGRKGLFGESLGGTDDAQQELGQLQAAAAALEQQIAASEKKTADVAAEAKKNRAGIARVSSGAASGEADAALDLQLQKARADSQRLINAEEEKQAELEALRNRAEVSDREYAARKTEIDQAIIDHQIALTERELEIERKRSATTGAEQLKRAAKEVDIQSRIDQLRSKRRVAGIQQTGAGDNGVRSAMQGMGEESAKLQWQIDHLQKYGQAITSAKEAQVQFDVEQGKWKDLLPEQKAELLAAARAIDERTAALARAQAGAEFEKQTRAIDENTASIGMNSRERELAAASQDLENKGIQQGTEQYEELIAKRRAALERRDAAQADPMNGIKSGIAQLGDEVNNRAAQMQDVLTNAFNGAADALTTFLTTGKADFADFAKSVIADLTRMIVKQMLFNAVKAMSGKFFGSGGTFGGGGGGNTNARLEEFADGGTFTNQIVNQDTPFKYMTGGGRMALGVMGEAGPEAIMPLSGGGVAVVDKGGQQVGHAQVTRGAGGRLSVVLPGASQRQHAANMPRFFAKGDTFGGAVPAASSAPIVAPASGGACAGVSLSITVPVTINAAPAQGQQGSGRGANENAGKQVATIVQQTVDERLQKECLPGGIVWAVANGLA